MKIRMDFVTNSSSSSFISISIKNKDILKQLKDGESFQGITGFINEDDRDTFEHMQREKKLNELFVEYYNSIRRQEFSEHDDYCLDDLNELFYSDFYNAEKAVFNAYLRLIEKEGGVKAELKDLEIDVYENASGEVWGGRDPIEREYGIVCDSKTTYTTIYYDNKGNLVRDELIEFGDMDRITEELLSKIITGQVSMETYFDKLNTTDTCLKEIVTLFQKSLKRKGKSDGEIKDLLGKYSMLLNLKKKDSKKLDSESAKSNKEATSADGHKYVGEWKDGKHHGQGTYTFADGRKYVGEFKDGLFHGHGTYTDADGRKYVGGFKDGKQHGHGTHTWANGDKYVGEFKDDLFHGQGTLTPADGSKYVGEFKDNMFHGQGKYTFADGAMWEGYWLKGGYLAEYNGEFNDGLFTGKGKVSWTHGFEYIGEFKDDIFHGQGTFTFAGGSKYVGEFKDGVYHGQGTYTFADGRKYVGEFKDDMFHGQGTGTYPDGTIKQGKWEYNKFIE